MDELIDQLPTVYDVRQALRVWHQPPRLANTHIGRSRLVRVRMHTTDVGNEAVSALASAARDVLLEAMRQLRPIHEHAPSLVLSASLVYRKYVLRQRITDICIEESISTATCNRHIANELEELSIILARMIAALPQSESPSEALCLQQTVFTIVPAPPPIFVGRDSQLREVCTLLVSDDSGVVVAVSGQPGSGKSALAAKLADDMKILRRYSDGIVWLEIGPQRDLRSCLCQLVADLNLDEETFKTKPIAQLRGLIRSALTGRRLLMILDDVWDAEIVHALMLGGRGAAYILTTRKPTVAHSVTNHLVTLGDFAESESLQLLKSHLTDQLLGEARIHVDLENLAARLCGLPLGVVAVVQNLARLAKTGQANRFNEYASMQLDRDYASALADRIKDSAQMLDEKEQSALVALSLFPPKPNTFSSEFGCAVAACESELLNLLVESGLVESQYGRYALHPATAEYATSLLTDEHYERMARCCAALTLRVGAEQFGTRDVLNVCAALDAATRAKRDDLYVAIAVNAVRLFEDSGNIGALQNMLATAFGKATQPEQRALIELHLAHANWLAERSEETLEQLSRVVERASASQDAALVGLAARAMADISFERDDFQSAFNFIGSATLAWRELQIDQKERVESMALRRYMLRSQFDRLRNLLVRVIPAAIADHVEFSQVLIAITAKGWLDFLEGETSSGIEQLNRAFERAVRNAHHLPTIFASGALAWAYRCLGQYDKARMMAYFGVHAPFRDVFPDFVAQAYNALGASAIAQGDFDNALHYLLEGLQYCNQHGTDAMSSELQVTLAEWHLLRGSWSEAWSCAEAAHHIASSTRFIVMIPAGLTMMGAAAANMHDMASARRCFEDAYKGHLDSPKANPWTEAYYRLHHGRFLLDEADIAGAAIQFSRSVALGRKLQSQEYVGLGLFGAAQTHLANGHEHEAEVAASQAIAALRSIGHAYVDCVHAWRKDLLGESP